MIQTKERNEQAKAKRAAMRAEFERERSEIYGQPQVSAPVQPQAAAEAKPAQPPQQQNRHQQQKR